MRARPATYSELHALALIATASFFVAGCGGGSSEESARSLASTDQTARILSVGAADAEQSVTLLTKVSEVRVSRTVYDYVYKVRVQNGPSAVPNATARLTAVGAGTTIVEGVTLVGDLASGATATPVDTITLRHDRALPFNTSALKWELTPYVPTTCQTSASALPRQTITVNGVTREYYEIAPSNVAALTAKNVRYVPVVVHYHDVSQDGQQAAAATCWNEVATANGGIAVFPSALSGTWNAKLDGGMADDVAFTRALVTAVQGRYGLPTNDQVYVTGVGQGGQMANVMAMSSGLLNANNRPGIYLSAVATVDAAADPAVLATTFPPSTMAAWSIKHPAFAGSDAQQVSYWNQQNSITAAGAATSDGKYNSTVYTNSVYTEQQVISSTTVLSNYSGKDQSQDIWDIWFKRKIRSTDDTRTNGTVRPNLTVAQMGLLNVTKTLSTGVSRRYLVYLPSNYAALTAGGKKLPLVFSLHGRNGAAEFIAVTSRWWEVAEKNGFIAVFVQGLSNTWNTSIAVGSSRVDLQACKLEYSIVSPK